jgi:hypothetical protein
LTADIHRHNYVCHADSDSMELYSSYIVAQMAPLGFIVRRVEGIAVTNMLF